MNEIVFASPRRFEVWKYSCSHSQLLMRSNKENTFSTRIEILFKGVDYMSIRSLLRGITITACMPGHDDFPADLSELSASTTIFRIASEGFTGFVAALVVFTKEDELEFFDESRLLTGPHF